MVRLNLLIGGRSFPVKVEQSEVEDLKKIEGQINTKISEFVVKYPGYSRIDVYTMAFLSIIFELNKGQVEKTSGQLEERLDQLSSLLEDSL